MTYKPLYIKEAPPNVTHTSRFNNDVTPTHTVQLSFYPEIYDEVLSVRSYISYCYLEFRDTFIWAVYAGSQIAAFGFTSELDSVQFQLWCDRPTQVADWGHPNAPKT